MACLRFLIVLVVLFGAARAADDSGMNAGEFQAMCGFIKELNRSPDKAEFTIGSGKKNPVNEALDDVQKIEELQAVTFDDKTFNQLDKGEKYVEASQNQAISGLTEKEWTRLTDWWKKEKEKTTTSGGDVLRRPPSGWRRDWAHERISKIYKKALLVQAELLRLEGDVEKSIFEATKAMRSAVYGSAVVVAHLKDKPEEIKSLDGLTATAESFGTGATSYVETCGGDGSTQGDKVGISILGDLTCLCVKENVRNNNLKYCVESTTDLGTTQSALTPAAGAPIAKQLHELCKRQGTTENGPKTTDRYSLKNIMVTFRGLLGRNVVEKTALSSTTQADSRKNSQFILGIHNVDSSNAGTKCTGTVTWSSHHQGVCVNYAKILGKGQEIPWLTQVQKAVEELTNNENRRKVQLSLISKIENLKNSAEIYYDFALESRPNNNATSKENQPAGARGSNTATLTNTEKEMLSSGSQQFLRSSSSLLVSVLFFSVH